jgi:hypothetical protein
MNQKPKIVCLCGSTRFMKAFQQANLKETLDGNIVLSIGCNNKSDTDLIADGELTEELKQKLDELHKRKIDLADEVLILNVGGYVGKSTRGEIAYAQSLNKPLRWLDPHPAYIANAIAPDSKSAVGLANLLLVAEITCEICGHEKTEDGCANCLKTELNRERDIPRDKDIPQMKQNIEFLIRSLAESNAVKDAYKAVIDGALDLLGNQKSCLSEGIILLQNSKR